MKVKFAGQKRQTRPIEDDFSTSFLRTLRGLADETTARFTVRRCAQREALRRRGLALSIKIVMRSLQGQLDQLQCDAEDQFAQQNKKKWVKPQLKFQ
jgi:hypothetical protein